MGKRERLTEGLTTLEVVARFRGDSNVQQTVRDIFAACSRITAGDNYHYGHSYEIQKNRGGCGAALSEPT